MSRRKNPDIGAACIECDHVLDLVSVSFRTLEVGELLLTLLDLTIVAQSKSCIAKEVAI